MNTNLHTKRSQDSTFQISPLGGSIGLFGSPNDIGKHQRSTPTDFHGSLLKCRNLDFQSDTSSGMKVKPPHLCFARSEQNNSCSLWSSQNESVNNLVNDTLEDSNEANAELKELDAYLHNKLQKLK